MAHGEPTLYVPPLLFSRWSITAAVYVYLRHVHRQEQQENATNEEGYRRNNQNEHYNDHLEENNPATCLERRTRRVMKRRT